MIDMSTVNLVHTRMNELLAAQGGRLDAVFFCPHRPEDDCDCRKPRPGMLRDIGRRYGVDLSQVPMVGDTLRDLQAARAVGCPPHLVLSGRAAKLSEPELNAAVQAVPGTRVHTSLNAFVHTVLRTQDLADTPAGGGV